MKKLDTKEFIKRAKEIHGERYDYSSSVYSGANNKLVIHCKDHGDFEQRPSSHLAGVGCVECGYIKVSKFRESTTEDFIEKSKAIYDSRFGYDKCKYSRHAESIILKCPVHGYFECLAVSHLRGNDGGGCKKCAIEAIGDRSRLNTATFIAKSKLLHGDKYDYSLVNYSLSSGKVNIICKEHGVFSQYAGHHLAGQGCQKCSNMGFDNNAEAHLYILKSQNITKVGITNKHPEIRVAYINKSFELSFDVETYFKFEKGIVARQLEKKCLQYLKSKYQPVQEVFDGSTECFLNVDLNDLLAFVSPLLQDGTQTIELEESSQPIMAQ